MTIAEPIHVISNVYMKKEPCHMPFIHSFIQQRVIQKKLEILWQIRLVTGLNVEHWLQVERDKKWTNEHVKTKKFMETSKLYAENKTAVW